VGASTASVADRRLEESRAQLFTLFPFGNLFLVRWRLMAKLERFLI
jgi:hypothetical protein